MRGQRSDLEDTEDGVRYCVTGMTDLLGFSGHLEIAGNDLRTSIGQGAISRLEVLERALQLVAEERASCEREYPKTFHYIRINDAIIVSLDLPDILKPSVGESVRNGFSPNELERFFDLDQFQEYKDFLPAYRERLVGEVAELVMFVGLLARLHAFVNRKENATFFPGARTVISTGYRRPFGATQSAPDFLSANFSFSNAYQAGEQLHGPGLYVDNNISQLLCANRFAQNLLRFACYTTGAARFDPFVNYEDVRYLEIEKVLTEPIDVTLFRKSFKFRQLDPYPMSFLHLVPRLMSYLEGSKEPAKRDKGWRGWQGALCGI